MEKTIYYLQNWRSQGVLVRTAYWDKERSVWYIKRTMPHLSGLHKQGLSNQDFRDTPEAAIEEVNKRRLKKIKLMLKEVERLKELKIELIKC